MTKKIVITGIGAFTPLAANARDSWDALLRGESGAKPLPTEGVFGTVELPVGFAATVAADPYDHLERVVAKRLDPSSQYALIAGREALADAGLEQGGYDPERLLVDWATGIGGVWSLLNAWDTLRERGARRVMPLTVPMLMPNAPGAAIGMDLEARAGIRTAVSACASSTESLIQAYDHLQAGDADIVIAGGSEAAVHPLPIAAFCAMQALSTRNDEPTLASRPYDVDRDGFVLGEGAAALVLETEEHALARGARIYGEIAGGAVTADAYHITAPEPEGAGASRAVEAAIAQAGATPDDVVHINAHATSTPVGDIAEYNAFKRVFGERVDEIPVSATKAATGHLLGGAGAIEAVFTALAFHEGVLPPTINVDEQDPEIGLDVVTEPRTVEFPAGALAISTSFGFGGHNAVLAIRKY
ncbi:MAG: beta-ketoacyl-[acyl-carrier-protein] synthase family protein [Microbacteriaceae bacterium]|nr:beta-ketoacyl-[acyl-carrier-protein] synthase family protein [Microbacteriaceae bacterium]